MKENLKSKGKAYGIMLSEAVLPNISVILKNNGYDFLIIDCEHGSFNFESVAAIIANARLCDICPIVRIPEIRREHILKYLDAGAGGLLVPMVKNAEEVREVVQYARYAPLGKRGISTTRAHNNYNSADIVSYMQSSNKNVLLFIQIELKHALESIADIAAVAGIDGLIIGPSDLSMDLGIFNDFKNLLLLEAVNKVVQNANEKDLYSGIITADFELLNYCAKKGMDIFSCDSEIGLINKGLKQNIKKLKGEIV